ncbi:unnamed protein product, partial [Durusdinium trenchii]
GKPAEATGGEKGGKPAEPAQAEEEETGKGGGPEDPTGKGQADAKGAGKGGGKEEAAPAEGGKGGRASASDPWAGWEWEGKGGVAPASGAWAGWGDGGMASASDAWGDDFSQSQWEGDWGEWGWQKEEEEEGDQRTKKHKVTLEDLEQKLALTMSDFFEEKNGLGWCRSCGLYSYVNQRSALRATDVLGCMRPECSSHRGTAASKGFLAALEKAGLI